MNMTQQIPVSENPVNEENVKTAMEDIALIKRIINHAEINLRRLGWLFCVYGSAALAFLVFDIAFTVFTSRTASLETASSLAVLMNILSYIVSIALFILFICKRRSIRKTENVHTMKLFDLWGVMLFAPVFLEMILLPVRQAVPVWDMALGSTLLSCMQFGALSICVFFTGHYIGCRTMKIIAAVLAVLFSVLYVVPIPFSGVIKISEISSAVQVCAYYQTKTSLISLLLPFVYIGMGVFSMKKQRGSVYGDQ